MSRPVDREKYEAKRSAIVRAASKQFATLGYQRSTTAGICRAAGVSSGTFFHYFPSKLDALVAVLNSGFKDLQDRLAQLEHDSGGLEAVMSYTSMLETEIGETSYPVFVAGLAGVESEASVATALSAETDLVSHFLIRNIEEGQHCGHIREDFQAHELATWVSWLLDGAAQTAATGPSPPGLQIHRGVRVILELPR
ncbi:MULTISPECIES: TetR/AcrR family transcriptional regulator [unclassified Arthrobacter]|uniref:TetR/AcrR family transcriptional regulator n=1 Tax=unclassified Arthrobacter TaxID=235627 RepID=UPI0014926CEA|nr:MULTISPECIES: TetR/AcrR family transcriptional regulator [unclassified Arthrobacter]MBE0009999.1 TetR/AcrR family transcriptional regulator [Arthrobacter sp. AET 35A]NOJ63828.1 TetR/AcrR family transcriptional regulator [Arthrobacter sp. 147(2020)]